MLADHDRELNVRVVLRQAVMTQTVLEPSGFNGFQKTVDSHAEQDGANYPGSGRAGSIGGELCGRQCERGRWMDGQMLVIQMCRSSGRSRRLIEVPQAQSMTFDLEVQQTVALPQVQHVEEIANDTMS